MVKNCDNCTYSGRPSYDYPCTSCTSAYGSAPSKWEIMRIEGADLVEVVRCKDCIQYNTYGCANGLGWCEAYDNGRMDNDYCSFGAKMDGDGNG